MLAQDLFDEVTALIEDYRGLRVLVAGDTGSISIDASVRASVRAFFTRTVDLCERLIDRLEEITEHDYQQPPAQGRTITRTAAAEEITSLAFVARAQLAETLQEINVAEAQQDNWRYTYKADAGVDQALKALIAIEASFCAHEEMPPRKRRWRHLDDAIAIRTCYAELRRYFRRDAAPSGMRLFLELRGAARRIASLRFMGIYPMMRVLDRLELRSFYKRIQMWLDAPDRHMSDGAETWLDLVAFVELLERINLRQELVDHDARVIDKVIPLLDRRADDNATPTSILQLLATVEGRDEILDEVLLRQRKTTTAELKRILLRVRENLEPVLEGSD